MACAGLACLVGSALVQRRKPHRRPLAAAALEAAVECVLEVVAAVVKRVLRQVQVPGRTRPAQRPGQGRHGRPLWQHITSWQEIGRYLQCGPIQAKPTTWSLDRQEWVRRPVCRARARTHCVVGSARTNCCLPAKLLATPGVPRGRTLGTRRRVETHCGLCPRVRQPAEGRPEPPDRDPRDPWSRQGPAHGGSIRPGPWRQPSQARAAGPVGTRPAVGANTQGPTVALRCGTHLHPVRTAGHRSDHHSPGAAFLQGGTSPGWVGDHHRVPCAPVRCAIPQASPRAGRAGR